MSNHKKKILITGGAGFVGTNLISLLSQSNTWDISVLDNERLGKREHVAEFGVNFVHGNILDRDLVMRMAEGADTIVHFAADTRVMDSIEDPIFNFDNNVVGSFNVLLAAREAGVRRIVNASTGGAILGEAPAPVHENMVANPLSPYGASKLAVEGYMSAFSGAYGLACASLRFSNLYGPRSYHKGSVVAHFYKQILAGNELVVYGDGGQVRDYLYIMDLVEGIRQTIESSESGVFQLGKGEPTTINELLDVIREVVGNTHSVNVRYEDFRDGEIHTTWCDISKARKQLNFNPSTPLREGAAVTWEWFKKNHS